MFALIALATTATTATFAVVRATLWRDLPYHDPTALVNIYTTEPVNRDSTQQMASSAMMVARWRENTKTLAGVEGYSPINLSVAGDGEPESLDGAMVSAGLFDLLGTPPAIGRTFRRDEEITGSGVIIVSDGVAQRRFGSSKAALGKTLLIDGNPQTVIGVMPPGFSLLFQGGNAWIPLDLSAEQQAKVGIRNIAVYGRLRPGASVDRARADLAVIQRDLSDLVPTMYAATQMGVRPLREALFGDRRSTMLVLLAAVGLVLIIAIINVANLTFADVLARRTQTMTRVALGAGIASLVGTRVREAIVLAIPSFVIALPVCAMSLALLSSISPEAFAPLGGRWIDVSIVAGAAATAFALALIGGIPAMLVEARTRATGIAGTVAKSGTSRDRRVQQVLNAAQAMVTVVLLGVAVLLGRDLARLMTVATGFVTDRVVVVRMNVASRERATVPLRAQYADALVRSVGAVPGVVDASAIQTRFNLNETMQSVIDIEGLVVEPSQRQAAQIRHAMPNVFRVLGVRVLSGRGIDSTDRADARPIAVVSASLARTYWPGASAIGKRIRRGSAGAPWLEVVGVVEDVMDAGLGVQIGPTLYVPYLQQNTATARVTVVARTKGFTSASIDNIRRAVWSVNPSQAIDDITPLTTLMTRSAAQPRFRTTVIGVFGLSAAALVVAGVYAITLFGVLSRRRELGIRAAIGASPTSLIVLATRSGLNPVLVGGVAGAVATPWAVNLTSSVIRSTARGGDVLISLGAVIVLLGMAVVAALIPARRAARVSPMEAIRVG
jgi:predicted permease